jgi:hypothetical protein
MLLAVIGLTYGSMSAFSYTLDGEPSANANYTDVTNDITCTLGIPARNYTPIVTPPIEVTLPGFFNLDGRRPEDLQILAVAAIFAQILVSRDREFAMSLNVHPKLNNEFDPGMTYYDAQVKMFNSIYDTFEAQREQRGMELNRTTLLGPLSSQQTRLINGLATVNTAPIVSYSATVSSLSSKFDYPWFFRVCYSDYHRWQAVADVMSHFGWRKAVMLTTPDFFGSASESTLRSLLNPGALDVHRATSDPSKMDDIARSIANSGRKVIFLLPGVAHVEMLNCFTMGVGCSKNWNMTQANGFVWIFGDAFPLYEANPSEAYCKALKGAIIVEFARGPRWVAASKGEPLPFPWGALTYLDVLNEAVAWYEARMGPVYFKQHFWTQEYIPFLVDSFYAIAHAYRSVRRQNQLPTGCAVKAALRALEFEGMTGKVAFDEQQDRTVSVFQLTSVTTTVAPITCSDLDGKRHVVGRWTSDGGLDIKEMPPEWQGVIPSDGVPLDFQRLGTSPTTGLAVSLFFIILITLPTLVALIYLRTTKVIRTSPPVHLILVIVSIDVLLAALIPITSTPTKASCVLQVLIAFMGFSLAIATFGGKALIYELMAHNSNKRLTITTNRRVLLLTAIIFIPVLIIGAIIIVSDIPNVVTTVEGDNYVSRCANKSSTSNYVLLTLCGITSMAALVLAFRNRNSPAGSLDAKYLMFATGNTILMATVAMFIAFLLKKKDYGAVLIVLIVAITFGSLANWFLIFGPRLFKLYEAHKKGTLWNSRLTDNRNRLRHMVDSPTPDDDSVGLDESNESNDFPPSTSLKPLSPMDRHSSSTDLPDHLAAPLLDPNAQDVGLSIMEAQIPSAASSDDLTE